MSRLAVPLRLGFLASHGGSNLQAILDAIRDGRLRADPRVVISNNSTATALERARQLGVPALHLSNQTHPDPEALDRAIAEALTRYGAELIVLAESGQTVNQGDLLFIVKPTGTAEAQPEPRKAAAGVR